MMTDDKPKTVKRRKRKKPYKLTPNIQKELCRILSGGCTRSAAIGVIRISRDTFYKWYADIPKFRDAVDESEAIARAAVEARVMQLANKGDKFMIMWWLQNRYPDDWKDTRNLNIDQTTTIEDKRISGLSDKQIVEELAKEGITVHGTEEDEETGEGQ